MPSALPISEHLNSIFLVVKFSFVPSLLKDTDRLKRAHRDDARIGKPCAERPGGQPKPVVLGGSNGEGASCHLQALQTGWKSIRQ